MYATFNIPSFRWGVQCMYCTMLCAVAAGSLKSNHPSSSIFVSNPPTIYTYRFGFPISSSMQDSCVKSDYQKAVSLYCEPLPISLPLCALAKDIYRRMFRQDAVRASLCIYINIGSCLETSRTVRTAWKTRGIGWISFLPHDLLRLSVYSSTFYTHTHTFFSKWKVGDDEKVGFPSFLLYIFALVILSRWARIMRLESTHVCRHLLLLGWRYTLWWSIE